jgi:hypothetical protein
MELSEAGEHAIYNVKLAGGGGATATKFRL